MTVLKANSVFLGTILIVDDDGEFREEFRELLFEYNVLEASNGRDATEILRRANDVNVVVLDVNMPGPSGIDILKSIKKSDPGIGVIILTGHSTKDVAIDALKGQADDYIEKPMHPAKIKEVIEKILERKAGTGEIDALDVRGKVEKAKWFVKRNCLKKTTLRETARSVCLSGKYLSRVFKEQTGENYKDYKLKIKFSKAKELLRAGGCNIDQIAEKLGYENTESFIRQFKKLTSCTPSVYRKKNRRKIKIQTASLEKPTVRARAKSPHKIV